MAKIVITQDFGFTPEQAERLKKLGNVTFYENSPKTKEEWMERAKGADIICSEEFGLKDNLYKLRNVFITYPFVEIGAVDFEALKKNDVTLANSPGCNKDAVTEWITAMMLNLFRKFPQFIKSSLPKSNLPKGKMLEITQSVKNKTVTMIGKGNIGSRIGEICRMLGMNVTYFSRNDNLIEKTKDSDLIINCLGSNKGTTNLLDRNFFFSLKKKPFFITFTKKEIYDSDAMIEALDKGILSGVAEDCGSEKVGDTHNEYYQKLLGHEKVLVTPHIAWAADISIYNGNETVINNIEAWVNKKPINVLKPRNP